MLDWLKSFFNPSTTHHCRLCLDSHVKTCKRCTLCLRCCECDIYVVVDNM